LYDLAKFYNAHAADNLLSTIEDYSKFVLYVLRGVELLDELQKEMVADKVRVNNFKHFGLKWWMDENINENGDFALVHGGMILACIASLLFYPGP